MDAIDGPRCLVKIKAGPHDLRNVFAAFYFWLVVTAEVVAVVGCIQFSTHKILVHIWWQQFWSYIYVLPAILNYLARLVHKIKYRSSIFEKVGNHLRDYIWWKQQVGNTDFRTWLFYPPYGLVPMSIWKMPYTFFFGSKHGFQIGFFRFGQNFSNLTLFWCTWKNHYFEHFLGRLSLTGL